MRYTLNDFENYIKKNIIEKLLPDIDFKIKSLEKELLIITPTVNNYSTNIKKNSNFSQVSQGSQGNFKTTEFIKKEGIDVHLYQIRKLFNMLTDKNYNKHITTIVDQIDFVIKNNTDNEICIYCNFCYDILSSNLLYSNISAQLYKTIIEKYYKFEEILNHNLNCDVIKERITKIVYVDANLDYDKFCDNNKLNEKTRAEFCFFTNLLKQNIISYHIIANIIIKIYEIVYSYIEEKNKKNELDEISEILYILITNSYVIIKKNDSILYKSIYSNIQRIITMKKENNSEISNKCLFKHMDILDLINK
jgi:hypothetical protein